MAYTYLPDYFGALRGSSQATPQAAGLIALAYEKGLIRTADDVRIRLAANTRVKKDPGERPGLGPPDLGPLAEAAGCMMLKLPALPAFLKKAQASNAPALPLQEGQFAARLGCGPEEGHRHGQGRRLPPAVVQEISRNVTSAPPVGSESASADRLPFTPPCIIGIEPWCWIDKLIPPSIEHKLFPYQFENVTMHILHLKMQGDVVTAFQNLSTPGQTVKSNPKTGATKDPQDVLGRRSISRAGPPS